MGIRNGEARRQTLSVTEAAKGIAVPDNQTILHVMPQEFIVDDQVGVIKPIGMNGVRLEARVLVVLAGRTALQNVIKCFESCGLRVQRIMQLRQLVMLCCQKTTITGCVSARYWWRYNRYFDMEATVVALCFFSANCRDARD